MRQIGSKLYGLVTLSLFLAGVTLTLQATTYSFRVKHAHVFGGCEGKLIISDIEIRYEADLRDHSRIWTYPHIKKIERKGLRKLIVHTYEDQALQFGRDKSFEFEFLDGVVSDEVFNFAIVRVGRPNQRVGLPPIPPGGRYEIATKHLHIFGGCEGTLKITDTHIEYVTPHKKDARLWKYLDIKRIEQESPYRLSIYTYEDQALQFGRDKVFHFELKESLEPAVVEFIRARLRR